MERLTKENVKDMNMLELSHNQVFVRDGWAWYRDYGREVSAVSFAKEMFARNGIEHPIDQEEFDDYMLELLADGYETIDGMIAMIYRLIWSMADVRESLKAYEDTGLTPEEIKDRLELEKAFSDAWEGNAMKAQELIKKLLKQLKQSEADRDYWEREAKKWCDKLFDVRVYAEGSDTNG